MVKFKRGLFKGSFNVVAFFAGAAQTPLVSILVTTDAPGVFDQVGPGGFPFRGIGYGVTS